MEPRLAHNYFFSLRTQVWFVEIFWTSKGWLLIKCRKGSSGYSNTKILRAWIVQYLVFMMRTCLRYSKAWRTETLWLSFLLYNSYSYTIAWLLSYILCIASALQLIERVFFLEFSGIRNFNGILVAESATLEDGELRETKKHRYLNGASVSSVLWALTLIVS